MEKEKFLFQSKDIFLRQLNFARTNIYFIFVSFPTRDVFSVYFILLVLTSIPIRI